MDTVERKAPSADVLATRKTIEESLGKLLAGTDHKLVEASRLNILATIDRAIAW